MSPTTDCNPKVEIPSDPAERLAERLSSILPDASVVQVRLQGPQTRWPHLGLTAVNARGRTLDVPRAKALTVARWIIRTFPQAGWAASGGHAFDLRTTELRGLKA